MSEKGFGGMHLMVAFVGGAAVGAVVALLTAPRTGAETRARIKDLGKVPHALREAGDAAKSAFSDALVEQARH